MKKDTILTMIVALGLITVVASALLAWVYDTTKEPIAKAEAEAKTAAIKAVAPEFNNVPGDDMKEITLAGDDKTVIVYPAMKDGQLVGAAVESYSMSGFSGEIDLMYGFDAEGNVTGYSVLKHAETPGLGAKMDTWFQKDGKGNVIGKNAGDAGLTVSKDGGDVDAITAATITSRAFLDALNRADRAFKQYKETAK